MHVASKVFLGLGVVVMLLGAVMTWAGGSSIGDAGEVDVEGKSLWNGINGTFYYDESDQIMVFVRDTVRCDEFTVTFSNASGPAGYENDECTEDGSKPRGYADDPDGWYHMGSFGWENQSKGKPKARYLEIQHRQHHRPASEEVGINVTGDLPRADEL